MRSVKLARKAHLLPDFLAVLEAGGIRQAAEKIHLSQPALTRRIQELEEALGVHLFERTPKGMALTPFGEVLLKHARSVELSLAEVTDEVNDLLQGACGEMRIATGTAWAPSLVPDAVQRLQKKHPAVSVTLLTHMSDAVQQLVEGNLDVVVGAAPLIHEEFVEYAPLLTVQQRVFAHESHALHDRSAVQPGELVPYPWIWLGETLAIKQPVETYFHQHGMAMPTLAVKTDSVQLAMRLLQAGGYLMLLPSTLTDLAAEHRLFPLKLDHVVLEYSAGLIYRPGTARMQTFQAFREILSELASSLGTTRA